MSGTQVSVKEYKGVYYVKDQKGKKYMAIVQRDNKRLIQAWFGTAREAAIGIDLALIKAGYDPINILKKK